MKVSLISHTPDALTLLLKTKNTRLSFDSDPSTWDAVKRQEHLDYMRDTIKSSWEFVDYVFQIEGVTRVFTHQLVRTRTGSYAQQAMRVVDARDFVIQMPPSVEHAHAPFSEAMAYLHPSEMWAEASEEVRATYAALIDRGIPAQDARGILPNNVETSIMCKFNLRTLSDMAKLRLCTRTQGEYQDVFREMRRLISEVHPWAAEFLEVHCVATGTCAFPRYGEKECPVYDPAMDNNAVREKARKVFWAVRHEAAPVARGGKAM